MTERERGGGIYSFFRKTCERREIDNDDHSEERVRDSVAGDRIRRLRIPHVEQIIKRDAHILRFSRLRMGRGSIPRKGFPPRWPLLRDHRPARQS